MSGPVSRICFSKISSLYGCMDLLCVVVAENVLKSQEKLTESTPQKEKKEIMKKAYILGVILIVAGILISQYQNMFFLIMC